MAVFKRMMEALSTIARATAVIFWL